MDPREMEDQSDSSDEDYVPSNTKEDIVSEDTGGDTEDDLEGLQVNEKSKKRRKRPTKSNKRQKNHEAVENLPSNDESRLLSEEEKKKVEDEVWADFKRDTGFKSRKDISQSVPVKRASSNSNLHAKKPQIEEKKDEKIKVTQVFNFAGENVTVEKEVSKNSTFLKNATHEKGKNVNKSGLGAILNQLGKKNKISTLEKSKLDWDQFKKEEKLEEELQTHNKGKDGYLERQDFLQRSDLRRFEIEKEIRGVERNKRLNNS